MSRKACFDDLPTEVLFDILNYLSVADGYKAFFHCNYRLRLITKKRTEFSRRSLDEDIQCFSTMHSWYKHLSFENGGTLFYLIPQKGKQGRYSFDRHVTSIEGLHWWFLHSDYEERLNVNERMRTIVTRHPIRLNPFFHHKKCESFNSSSTRYPHHFYGGYIIFSRYKIEEWLTINYPDHVQRICHNSDADFIDIEYNLVPIFDGEWLKATAAVRAAAIQIWDELKELIDINPFEIQLKQ